MDLFTKTQKKLSNEKKRLTKSSYIKIRKYLRHEFFFKMTFFSSANGLIHKNDTLKLKNENENC